MLKRLLGDVAFQRVVDLLAPAGQLVASILAGGTVCWNILWISAALAVHQVREQGGGWGCSIPMGSPSVRCLKFIAMMSL